MVSPDWGNIEPAIFGTLSRRSLDPNKRSQIGAHYTQVAPSQPYGLEINPHARELARTAIWIGYIQWHYKNGFPIQRHLVLHTLDTITQTDAVLDVSDPDHPGELAWPEAGVIVGNRPFLGGKLLRTYLGDS